MVVVGVVVVVGLVVVVVVVVVVEGSKRGHIGAVPVQPVASGSKVSSVAKMSWITLTMTMLKLLDSTKVSVGTWDL